jgi:hypothetical protein
MNSAWFERGSNDFELRKLQFANIGSAFAAIEIKCEVVRLFRH